MINIVSIHYSMSQTSTLPPSTKLALHKAPNSSTSQQPMPLQFSAMTGGSNSSNSITWIRVSTSYPSSTVSSTSADPLCRNCTRANADDWVYNESDEKKQRRKRRRNRVKEHQKVDRKDRVLARDEKKHSKRVQLDKPVLFISPAEDPHQKNANMHRETASKPGEIETYPATAHLHKVPPPARYLLPPITVLNAEDRKQPTDINGQRGTTKFKNTLYYNEDSEINEIRNSVSNSGKISNTDEKVIRQKALKPIVVQPVIMPTIKYLNIAPDSDKDQGIVRKALVLSNEVANEGMKVANMSWNMGYQDEKQRTTNTYWQDSRTSKNTHQQSLAQTKANFPLWQTHQWADSTDLTKDNQHPKTVHQADSLPVLPSSSSPPMNLIKSQIYYSTTSAFLQNSPYNPKDSELRPPPSPGLPSFHHRKLMRYDLTARQQYQEIQEPHHDLLPPYLSNIDSKTKGHTPSPMIPLVQKNQSQFHPISLPPPRIRPQLLVFQTNGSWAPTQIPQQQRVTEVGNLNIHSGKSKDQNTWRVPTQRHSPPRAKTATESYHFTIESSSSWPVNNGTRLRNNKNQSSNKGLDLAESQYFSDPQLPTEEEVASLVQNIEKVIPGTAGSDYPLLSQHLLQKRRFACQGLEGYFADISTRCQVFYICNGNGAGEPMLCPNGTLFSQDLLVCDWWYNVDC